MGDTKKYHLIAQAAAERHGLDPDMFVRQIRQESGFNPDVVSPAGARGIAQIMPATAKGWGVDPMDPVASLEAAARNMASYIKTYMKQGKDLATSQALALAAYNAGPVNVAKYGGVPPFAETQNYVKRIMGGGKYDAGKKSGSSNPMDPARLTDQPPSINVPAPPTWDTMTTVGGVSVPNVSPAAVLGVQPVGPLGAQQPEVTSSLPELMASIQRDRLQRRQPQTNFFSDLASGFGSVYSADVNPGGGGVGTFIGQTGGLVAPAIAGFAVGGPVGAGLGAAGAGGLAEYNNEVRTKQPINPLAIGTGGVVNAVGALLPGVKGASLLSRGAKALALNTGFAGAADAAQQLASTGQVDANQTLENAAKMGVPAAILQLMLHRGGNVPEAPVMPPEAPKVAGLLSDNRPIAGLLPGGTEAPRMIAGSPTRLLPGAHQVDLLGGGTMLRQPDLGPIKRLPNDGGVLLEGQGRTEGQPVRPASPDATAPGGIQAVPDSGAASPLPPQRQFDRASVARKYIKELETVHGYSPEEILLTQQGNKATVVVQPSPHPPEVQAQLDALRKQYQDRVDFHNRNVPTWGEGGYTAKDYQQLDKNLKGAAMQYAAEKRRIIQGNSFEPVEGGLTPKELDTLRKQKTSMYEGKPVVVNGVEGKVVNNAYGKVRVQLPDGEVKLLPREAVEPFLPEERALAGLPPREVAPTQTPVPEAQPTVPETPAAAQAAQSPAGSPEQRSSTRGASMPGDPDTATQIGEFARKFKGVYTGLETHQQQSLNAAFDAINGRYAIDIPYRTKTGSTSMVANKTVTPTHVEVRGNAIRIVGRNEFGQPGRYIVADFAPGADTSGGLQGVPTKSAKAPVFQDADPSLRPQKVADEVLEQQAGAIKRLASKFPQNKTIQAMAKDLEGPVNAKTVQKAVKRAMSLSREEADAFLTELKKRC